MAEKFSELLRILRKYIGNQPSIQEFMTYFFYLLIDTSNLEDDHKCLDEMTFACRSQKSTANKVFNGIRPIPKKIARFINTYFTQTKLIDALYKIPPNPKELLLKDLNNSSIINIKCTEQDIDEKIANEIQSLIRDSLSLNTSKYTIAASSKNLSSRDLRFLSKLMHDFNNILKFCIETDPTINPMPLEYPEKFDNLYLEWKNYDTDFQNNQLNSLKRDILNNLDAFFSYWGCHMWYDASTEYYVYKKPLGAPDPEEEENLKKKVIAFNETFTELHFKLCNFVKTYDIET